MDAVITSQVRISIKILPPPQAYVHFCHFTNGDYCVTIPYILISSVRENRSKAALYNRVNPVLMSLVGQSSRVINLGGLMIALWY